MTAPVTVDNVTLGDATDFAALAHEVLLGGGGVGARRSDNFPLDWILRAYDELAGSPYADRLARGVASCLTAPEAEVRAQALVFFQRHPAGPAGERIDELVAAGDRTLFAEVPDPVHPGTDLSWQLLAALAARIGVGDRRALDLARSEVVRPGKAAPLIAEMVAAAPDWVVARAEDIVRATPAAGATLLIQLQGSGRDLVAIGRRIARWCKADARFELDVSRFIDDPEVRQAILDAFRAA
jgi:hypothetical protein